MIWRIRSGNKFPPPPLSQKTDSPDRIEDVLKVIHADARKRGVKRIAIIWDEFGHQLESLASGGQPVDLLAVQTLAEWAVRKQRPIVTLTTLMHRGVDHYARQMLGPAHPAWRKIEGRFETLQLTALDSDAYGLIAVALRKKRRANCHKMALQAQSAGLFSQFADPEVLAGILEKTAPLTPAALYLLPRLASQIAQSERTVFDFLKRYCQGRSTRSIGINQVYEHFAPAIGEDLGPGGTYRRLIEAETALSRTTSELQSEVIKAVTLLQYGGGVERARLTRATLVFSLTAGTRISRYQAETAIEKLIERKILLYRQRIDDISVWHGTDVDLVGIIAEEASRLEVGQDVAVELERLFPPDAYTAPQYNYEYSITRFARGRFVRVEELLDDGCRKQLQELADQADALVVLVVNAHVDDAALVETIESLRLPSHCIIALPKFPLQVETVLAELNAIDALLGNADLISEDPLIPRELNELRAAAEVVLRRQLETLINPDLGGVSWFIAGKQHDFTGGNPYGGLLTGIFLNRFANTPRIRNEQVVRCKVSTTTRSARKRCLLAIIERSGLPALGYEGSTSADSSIYRTVFERTHLYRWRNGAWSWASWPDNGITDPGIRQLWEILHRFHTHCSPKPKKRSYDKLLQGLTDPKKGLALRDGLLPLMITAGLQAFAKSVALREKIDGRYRYVSDISPSVIERICERPSTFQLEVVMFSESHDEEPQEDHWPDEQCP